MGSLIWTKLRFLTVAGVGLYSDDYLNITIDLVGPKLGYIYFKNEKNVTSTALSDFMTSSLSLGMIFGQFHFVLFGHALGRPIVYSKELVLTIYGTLLVIFSP